VKFYGMGSSPYLRTLSAAAAAERIRLGS